MYERFAAVLRELMEASEVSGAELGRRLDGTDKSLVSRWRSGRDRPEAETVARIAAIFGVDQVSMLQLAGWLPGEPKDISPRRASLMMLVRDQVPEEDLDTVERMLKGLKPVQPAQRASTGRRDGASTRRRVQPGQIDTAYRDPMPLAVSGETIDRLWDRPAAALASALAFLERLIRPGVRLTPLTVG